MHSGVSKNTTCQHPIIFSQTCRLYQMITIQSAVFSRMPNEFQKNKQPRPLSTKQLYCGLKCISLTESECRKHQPGARPGLLGSCEFLLISCFGPCVVFSYSWHSCGFTPEEATDCSTWVRRTKTYFKSGCKTFLLWANKWHFFCSKFCMRANCSKFFPLGGAK